MWYSHRIGCYKTTKNNTFKKGHRIWNHPDPSLTSDPTTFSIIPNNLNLPSLAGEGTFTTETGRHCLTHVITLSKANNETKGSDEMEVHINI